MDSLCLIASSKMNYYSYNFVNYDGKHNSLRKTYDVWAIIFLFLFDEQIKGVMFYAPRLFWAHQEEGKLEQMIKGVRDANKKRSEMASEKRKEVERNCADNVINYLHMKEGGHWQYGMSYVIAQVRFILCY